MPAKTRTPLRPKATWLEEAELLAVVEAAADATELDALVLELAGLVADPEADAAVLVADAEGGVVKDTLWGVAEGPLGLIERGAHWLCWRARAAFTSAAEQCS